LTSSYEADLAARRRCTLPGRKAITSGFSPVVLAGEGSEPLLDRLAASSAAMPLRSEPDEAAVAEVFGTLPVVVAVILTRSSPMPNLRHHLRHLLVESLPHLGAAMVQRHRAVGVDMHQRTGLVCTRSR
jgi:hypothetical protein